MRLAAFVALTLTASAQTPPAPAPPMQRFYMTGGVFQTAAHPELTGIAAVAVPLNAANTNWSYTSYDVVPVKLNGTITFQTSVRSGICTQTKIVWKAHILACADGGIAQANNKAAGAVTFTIPAVIPISNKVRLVPAYRQSKTALDASWRQDYILGVGMSF